MGWLIAYAVLVTIAAVWCAIGWKLAHDSLAELCDVDDDAWPTVRGILRQAMNRASTTRSAVARTGSAMRVTFDRINELEAKAEQGGDWETAFTKLAQRANTLSQLLDKGIPSSAVAGTTPRTDAVLQRGLEEQHRARRADDPMLMAGAVQGERLELRSLARQLELELDATKRELFVERCNPSLPFSESVITGDRLANWLKAWWVNNEGWREEMRHEFGPDIAQHMRGVADMIERCAPSAIEGRTDDAKDAARYRHLRANWSDFSGYDSRNPGEWLDNTIDAVLNVGKEPKP